MPEAFQPISLLSIELHDPLPPIQATHDGKRYTRARALVKLHKQPVAQVDFDLTEDVLPPSVYEGHLWEAIREPLQHFLANLGLPMVPDLAALRTLPDTNFPKLTAPVPKASVVISTRDRAAMVRKCIPSMMVMDYPNYEVILVDNAPTTDATAQAAQELTQQYPNLRYVLEKRPGGSFGRNAGLAAAQGDYVVYTDDDVLPDANWLTMLIYNMIGHPEVACVTGLTLPIEMETRAQDLFEQFGGSHKGRAYERLRFSLKLNKNEPLFPYLAGKFGAGVNAAFRIQVLRELNGFDPALGPGTIVKAAEDTDMFFRVIMAGHTLVYEPGAIVYHHHYTNESDLKRVLTAYGIGFGAFVLKSILDNPLRLLHLLRQIPFTLYYLFNSKSDRNVDKRDSYPSELTQGELWGMVKGPFLYLRSRRAVKKLIASAN